MLQISAQWNLGLPRFPGEVKKFRNMKAKWRGPETDRPWRTLSGSVASPKAPVEVAPPPPGIDSEICNAGDQLGSNEQDIAPSGAGARIRGAAARPSSPRSASAQDGIVSLRRKCPAVSLAYVI